MFRGCKFKLATWHFDGFGKILSVRFQDGDFGRQLVWPTFDGLNMF